MTIQWYPGHMYKANKLIKQALPQIDLVIEVLDARIPFSSENPLLRKMRGNKPCIKILNKCDLADPATTQLWQDYFEQSQDIKTLAINKDQVDKIKTIPELCRKLLSGHSNRVKNIHTMIMGIPNVGKSTLINLLAGRIIAKTGNEPAVTKAQQRIQLAEGIVMSDTPGVLWPKIEFEQVAYRLAATGAIKDTAMDSVDVALFTLAYLASTYPDLLKQRYHLPSLPSTELEVLESIGRKRGCLRRGGQVQLDQAAKIILTELRASTLGKVSMETPALVQQDIADQAKAAEKALLNKSRT
ncbi:MAG: ribosome biogenesis GTPase YlqF [Thiohalomonadales bacterium]